MDETIVGNDIRHGEDAAVAGLGQDVAPGPGQGPARSDERFVHPVHPSHHRPGAGQVELGPGSARQHTGLRALGGQRPDGGGVHRDVGVQVGAGERHARRVAEAQRVRLARHVGLDDADAGHPPRGRGRPVGAGVGDDDDIELTRSAAGEQAAKVPAEDGFLVVRRNDDADHGVAHAANLSRIGSGGHPQ
jgi:hypothetical protein